jgi:hypothetical protein
MDEKTFVSAGTDKISFCSICAAEMQAWFGRLRGHGG